MAASRHARTMVALIIMPEILSLICGTFSRPLASAISWAKPTSRSKVLTMPARPPRSSQRPSEWAKVAARKDALVGHEHVVEDHEAVGRVLAAGDREAPLVLVAGRVVDIDDLHA